MSGSQSHTYATRVANLTSYVSLGAIGTGAIHVFSWRSPYSGFARDESEEAGHGQDGGVVAGTTATVVLARSTTAVEMELLRTRASEVIG